MKKKPLIYTCIFILFVMTIIIGLRAWFSTSTTSITDLARTGQPGAQLPLTHRLIPDTDLPPPGTRSLFDHLIVQNDGLPYPFSKLIRVLREKNPAGTDPITLLIPHGRSLLKGQADDAHPRVVVAADFQGANTPAALGMNPQGQLFLGFVENAHEIEVLSYNEAAGRYEFQLVQNYCEGCVPRIVYARRAICTTCHQGAAPIFSQRPWNETNGQPATAAAIAQARGKAEPYQGVALQQPLSQPERFDQLTDVGNFYQATQRLWLDGCGEQGNACRRLMLSLALRQADAPGEFDTNSADANRLRQLQAASFPKDGIAVPESDLHNRDPIGEKQGVKGWLHTLFTRQIHFGEGAKDNEDLGNFDRLPPLSPEVDPLTVRPPKQLLRATDIDGVYGVASFFTEADLKLLGEENGHDVKRLLARVEALPDGVFDARPFSRVAMMNALLQTPKQYCCLKTDEMSPPVASGVPPLAIAKHPELKNFEQYCFACHRGNPAKRLNFMGGENEDAVLAGIQAKKEIRDWLDWERYEGTDKASKLMPPRDSVQYQRLKQAGPDVRAKMRETVPSLFDF